jgi:hypothetical protein
MRRFLAAIGSALVLAGLPACAGKTSPPTYRLPPEQVRALETPLPGTSMAIGEVGYAAIGIRTKIVSVVGSHADLLAKGQYVRIRLAMANHGKERHNLDLYQQLLVTGDGRTHPLSYDAMEISRAPDGPFTIASQEVREVDLWFDIPADATVRALRVVGDPSSSRLSDQLKGAPVPGSTRTVDLPLTS